VSQRRPNGLLAAARSVESAFDAVVARYSLPALRYSLVVVFVWFGTLTALQAGEGSGLVASTFGVTPSVPFVVALGAWEVAIGLALLWRRTVRLGVVLIAAHALVTTAPLLLLPGETFVQVPYAPTFTGVYIVKNWVLLGGAMTVGGAIDSAAG